MNADRSGPFEVAEIVHEKPLSGEFEEVLFGSDSGNTLWVKFSDKHGVSEWIGKFGAGGSAAARVSKAMEPDKFFVSAGGFGYLVDASSRKLLNYHAQPFSEDAAYDSINNEFIVADYVRIRLIKDGKQTWASKRIALDGIRDLKIEGRILSGLAVIGFEGQESRFALDLNTLEVTCPADFSLWER